MPHPQFDRSELLIKPLSERENKVSIERDHIRPGNSFKEFAAQGKAVISETAERMRTARAQGRPRMLAFGAHTIKNGLAPVLSRLVEDGWLTHLATNGAGIIHDWEFAFQGWSSEDVRANVARGRFGIWQETGLYLNLAIAIGAWEGLGYGESVGKMIAEEGLDLPTRETLLRTAGDAPARGAAALDLLDVMETLELDPGRRHIPHPFKLFSLQASAWRANVPLTGHPMIGHDIIYTHPANSCAAVGRTAQRDFLAFARNVADLEGGVYLSVGSAVMSPMIFEKSFSMAQNMAIQAGRPIKDHLIVVVDLQESRWDWSQGEPPMDNPDYYLRFNKTFARMGGRMHYLSSDNRDFLLALERELSGT